MLQLDAVAGVSVASRGAVWQGLSFLGAPRPGNDRCLGGLSAVVFIAATTLLAHRTGVLLLGLGIIAGQLVASLALGAAFSEEGVTALTVAGTVLALVAVLFAGSRSRSDFGPMTASTRSTTTEAGSAGPWQPRPGMPTVRS